jgi:hypothetical protein
MVEWKGGPGNWEDAAMWGGTLPSQRTEARVSGTKEKPSEVTLTRADVLVSHLSIAESSSNVASLVLDGPSLTVSGSFDVGKYNGSDGRLVVKSGQVFGNVIFLSGGGGPGGRGRGTVEIPRGSVVRKDIELGASAGCSSTLHIVGSKATGIVAEDGLHIGVYNYLDLEKEPLPSASELIFDLDAAGVTPIFTWGKTEGCVNFPVPDEKRNGVGTCRLRINLVAVPPSGDILLIGCEKPCHGGFTGLAEGGAVRANYDGKVYEWKLTYRGGPTGCDIMLTEPRVGTRKSLPAPGPLHDSAPALFHHRPKGRATRLTLPERQHHGRHGRSLPGQLERGGRGANTAKPDAVPCSAGADAVGRRCL